METKTAKIWNVTLYLRLSREDGDKEESNSITGQRELLREYLKAHPELREYAVRIDDGWSGSSFERPSFKAMMEDVKAGKTDCVICKDLSRFGRNYLDAGEYIERIFPFLGVRFIAVNDNYDSMNKRNASDDIIVPFKNLINEAYCRDISVKIRSQLDIKRRSGQFIGAFAVYGYLKDPNNKHQLIIDEYAADIVRDIYKSKLAGVNPQNISDKLNRNGILSPIEYKKSLGMKCYTPFQTNATAKWSAANIIRILKNPVYTGTLIQGIQTTPSYKVHKRISKPEDEWAIAENNHEAIIDCDTFDNVQKVLSLDTRRAPESEEISIFSGIVFCGKCGASMVRKTVPSGNRKYVYYVCSAHKQNKSCSPHRIRDTVLEEITLTDLQRYIRNVTDIGVLLETADIAPLAGFEVRRLQRQLEHKREDYEKQQRLLMSLYENLADGIINRDEYSRMKESFTVRAVEAEKQMEQLRESLDKVQTNGGEGTKWIEQFKKFKNITVLDRTIVISLIDRILISPDNSVEIRYRWQDEFTELAETLEKTTKEAV